MKIRTFLLTPMTVVVAIALCAAPVQAEPSLDKVHSENARTRAFAVRDLGETGGPESVAPLVNALGDDNIFVRAAAMQALHALGSHDLQDVIAEKLLSALDSNNDAMRAGAAETLGLLKAEAGAMALMGLLEDSAPTVQHAAACALARLEAGEAVDALSALVGNEDAMPFARMGAAWALGELRHEAAVAPLLEVVLAARRGTWHYTSVPVYAVEALGKINDQECLPRLVEALTIEDRHLRAQLAETLAAMTGEDFGADQEKWQAFLTRDS